MDETGESRLPDGGHQARSLLGRTNRDWWPEALPVDMLHQGGVSPDPMGDGLRLCRSVQEARLCGAEGAT